MKQKTKQIKCCICQKEYDERGTDRLGRHNVPLSHTAEPVMAGLCCEDCHYGTVIAARIMESTANGHTSAKKFFTKTYIASFKTKDGKYNDLIEWMQKQRGKQ
tara:strand:+ start:4467 stop:4775 length:309 start_codon:yes stop_codon:yes gene_type:complete